ncbi:MAG: hypothetical protein AAFZ67_11390 [Planctomycetota bacterium]
MQIHRTESDRGAAVPTWSQRLEAHRFVERVRSLDVWPDFVDLLEVGIESTGLTPPTDPVVASLVLTDLWREVRISATDGGYWDHPEWPPCDPVGELTGRVPMSRLVARRTDPGGSVDQPATEGVLPLRAGLECCELYLAPPDTLRRVTARGLCCGGEADASRL